MKSGIPRVLAIILFVVVAIVTIVLGIINFFAEFFGLERDLAWTAWTTFFLGVIVKAVLPSKKDDENDDQSGGKVTRDNRLDN